MIAPASALIELPVETEVFGGDVPRRHADWSEIGPRKVYIVDPLCDPRWDGLLRTHPRASLFHSSDWLRALATTYGYRPIAYSTCGFDEPLRNAAVFCEIESWMTGKRLVSLPFSDYCDWLIDNKEDAQAIGRALEHSLKGEGWRYIETRPQFPLGISIRLRQSRVRYAFHELDLRPSLDSIFSRFHKSSTQRKISRARREGLAYREGSSDELLDHFYRLLRMTRERHGLPAQPRKWFANLIQCCGDAVKIRVAFKDARPVAAMITVRYKDSMIYKYGCSDSQFNRFGGMHLLFWNSIQEAKHAGLRRFDFGRTDADQQGLITFKGRWGAAESVLDYARYSAGAPGTHALDLPAGQWKIRAAKFVVSHLPSIVVSGIGRVIYGHAG
jgi:CelD/BcsL family acetyltransferase involved in cellulose biosynthesis